MTNGRNNALLSQRDLFGAKENSYSPERKVDSVERDANQSLPGIYPRLNGSLFNTITDNNSPNTSAERPGCH